MLNVPFFLIENIFWDSLLQPSHLYPLGPFSERAAQKDFLWFHVVQMSPRMFKKAFAHPDDSRKLENDFAKHFYCHLYACQRIKLTHKLQLSVVLNVHPQTY